jgi:hypothetical protein
LAHYTNPNTAVEEHALINAIEKVFAVVVLFAMNNLRCAACSERCAICNAHPGGHHNKAALFNSD